jgi:hypothetical protein
MEADPPPPVLTPEQVRLCEEALAYFESRSKQLDVLYDEFQSLQVWTVRCVFFFCEDTLCFFSYRSI